MFEINPIGIYSRIPSLCGSSKYVAKSMTPRSIKFSSNFSFSLPN